MIKPPTTEDGRATGYHQDLPHMPVDRKGGCTLWLALVDLPDNAGTLRFVQGSHQWGPLGRYDSLDQDWLKEHPHEDATLSSANELRAGDATIHDLLTIHGTDKNESGVMRIAYALTYVANDVLYTGAPGRFTDNLELKINEPLDHDYFPVIVNGSRGKKPV
jgi:ectoine hydroxylase-related dioxygenase (phytanoyl-CoA dioxygenase family)